MKLVACPACHSQYDVGGLSDDAFDCHCGTRVETRGHPAVDVEVHRCSACGALVSSDAADCSYCGSAIVRDAERLSLICPECYARNADDARFCAGCGVAFRPQPLPGDVEELACPACEAPMAATAVAGLPLHECPKCRGLWVPDDHFRTLVDRATERHRAGGHVGQAAAPRVEGANPTRQPIQYRRCPSCRQFMHRQNFRKTSGVIIDVCRRHGTWLDADELERIAGFLLSGGRPRQSAFMAAAEARDEAEYQKARRLNDALRTRGHGGWTHASNADGEGTASLLSFLTDLIG